jgi:acetylornithine deacetylase
VPGDNVAVLRQAYFDRVAALRAEMQAVRPEADIHVDIMFDVPPLKPEAHGAAEELVRALTGDNSTNVVSYGTEAGHFQRAGYSAVVCGPGDIAQAHQPDEYISVAEFEAGHRFMEELVARLAG